MGGYSGGGALGGLAQGLVAGRELRMRLQQAADQHQQLQQAVTERQQDMTARDIQNRMLLEQSARPVSDAGTVSQSFDAPLENGLPGEAGKIPASPNPINFERPADKSRTVKYGGGSYELLTPEEQITRTVNRARAMQRATAVPVKIPDNMRAPGGPDTAYVDPAHLAQYMSMTGQYTPVAVPGTGGTDEDGTVTPPMMVPTRALPSILNNQNTNRTRTETNAVTNQTRAATNAVTNATREKVATGNNETRASIADDNREAANTRATSRNATTIQAAGIRATPKGTPGTPTAGQQGVQNRFDQRELAKIEAEENGTAKQDGLHAQRTVLGQQLASGKDEKGNDLNAITRNAKAARLKGITDSLQQLQYRKAKIYGMQAPPQDVASKIPEGQQATSPDGHVWAKKDGVVYLVK